MMKHLKYTLLTGVALSLAVGFSAQAETNSTGWSAVEMASSHSNTGVAIGKAVKMFSSLGAGIPVLDITSVPAHAVVATEQEFIRLRTEIEEETKDKIKERLSVTNLPKTSFGYSNLTEKAKSGISASLMGGMRRFAPGTVDAKLSYVGIQSKDANSAVEEGIVDKGIEISGGKYEIEEEGKKDTYDLAAIQQANWISTKGSLDEKEAYAKKRQYIQQEQAIRMLALAVVLRKNVEDKVMCPINGPIGKAKTNYDKSDTKKDLDGKTGKVEKTNDYNQSLRQYAYYGLIYDQLLSLEQQVMGLRLQTKGGRYVQSARPITDLTESEKPTPKGGLQDEAQQDKKQGTGTRKNSG